MYPDNNQPYQPTDVDYLDQIANKPAPKGFGRFDKKIWIIGGLFLVAIIIVIAAVASNQSQGLPNAEVLGARLAGLNKLITYGQGGNITDSTAKQMVAELSLLRSGDRVQLAKIFGSNPSYTNPSADALAAESVDAIINQLDAAKSTGQINSLFKTALTAKVNSVVQLLQTSLTAASTPTERQILLNSITNYQTILKRFASD